MRRLMVMVAVVLALPIAAYAQCPSQGAGPVINPANICFPASPDHAVTELGQPKVTGYKVILKKVSDGSTVSTTDIGKPTPVNGVISVPNWAVFGSLTLGTEYVLTSVAYGPGGTTPDGDSVSFGKPSPPAAPGTVVVTP